ncbi:hypothetical protein CDD81_5254 [Ophiocordyceps australis]|uniref:FCP1 homology domain-containing protein n=1 Tax=Ophiocordyceps australis TaxID=1399860 RepID=A0A2C5YHY2_9HYPO|nr:hypothetical protein CDD81_5254 [Ophiocordyceps australis]
MNSINIITARVSPQEDSASKGHDTDREKYHDEEDAASLDGTPNHEDLEGDQGPKLEASEATPLLDHGGARGRNRRASWWHRLPRSAAASMVGSFGWLLATLASPGVYLLACLHDDSGKFAPLSQFKKLFGMAKGTKLEESSHAPKTPSPSTTDTASTSPSIWSYRRLKPRPAALSASSASGSSSASSDSEFDASPTVAASSSQSKHNRSKSLNTWPEPGGPSRSIRIKLSSDEALGQRKHRRARSAVARGKGGGEADLSAQLKSPTSPIAGLTRYPKTPAPPRPLIPRRQPSYINLNVDAPPQRDQKKTLILDLDETLIHSMSKGGRMSSGHMVEVRLNTASLGMGSSVGASGAAQHPILYWVNKRPFCDDFLRRVCKWYNLVVFTASVQEYADPVIDWLESERKFFSARYYRQHCTYRQGAYIKDLSFVEPDLSKVMILDNSPLSYLFHEDNAIPIQGWINDPTDSDLMHLIPLLEGLQYVHDVRALLALRGGEDGQQLG